MVCPNCNYNNNSNSTFCMNCGIKMITYQNNNVTESLNTPTESYNTIDNNTLIQNIPNQMNVNSNLSNSITNQISENINENQVSANNIVGENVVLNQTNQNNSQLNMDNISNIQNQSNSGNKNYGFIDYLKLIFSYILKPNSKLKNEYENLSVVKNSIFILLISLVILSLSDIISLIINYSSYDGFSLELLKEVEYIDMIKESVLVYVAIILGISVVYFIAGKIVKKRPDFCRMLAISAIAIIPAVICSSILMPLIGMIKIELGMIIMIVGFLYSVIILFDGLNEELQLQGNIKIYLNLICTTILIIAGYKLFMYLLMESVNDNLGNVFDFFMY